MFVFENYGTERVYSLFMLLIICSTFIKSIVFLTSIVYQLITAGMIEVNRFVDECKLLLRKSPTGNE